MKTTVTLKGIEDVNKLLEKVAPRQAINIMRATVHDMAGSISKDAKADMPVDEGDMKKGTKHHRRRGKPGQVQSDVAVAGAFYWRFLEYGQGPDGEEHAFFLKAVEKMRAEMVSRFLTSFGKKWESALARARKRAG